MTKLAPKKSITPISCIYYGDENTLKEIRNAISIAHPQLRLVYCFHKPDTDDKKEHAHVLIRTLSNCINNTDAIRKYFKHPDDDNFYITPFVVTKENALVDWYEYVQHKSTYLQSKGLQRNVEYSEDDVKGDSDLLALIKDGSQFVKTVSEKSDLDIIKDGIENGLSDWEILQQLSCVKADNLNAILCGIKKMRAHIDYITPELKSQIVDEFLVQCGLYDAVKHLFTSVSVKGRTNGVVTRSDVNRYLAICIEKSYTTDEIAYILDGEISPVK